MPLHYPLDLRFKLLAIASQIEVRDASDKVLLYVKQKAFKLKEAVTVYSDRTMGTALYRIDADRMIDWSAQYAITQSDGRLLGSIRRKGMRSLWRARYEITGTSGALLFTVQEASAWIRILDGVLGELPVVNLLTGYLFHPSYVVAPASGAAPVMRATKQPALFEGRFRVERLGDIDGEQEELVLLGILMMLLLERVRG